jgi:hypothetical protein
MESEGDHPFENASAGPCAVGTGELTHVPSHCLPVYLELLTASQTAIETSDAANQNVAEQLEHRRGRGR